MIQHTKRIFFVAMIALATQLAGNSSARAQGIELPSIGDPFSTQKKLAPYGKNLKPTSCPTPPDTSKPLLLGEVVITTICHSPDTRSAYLSLLASADSYDGTVMSYLPDISASATGSSSKTWFDGNKFISRSSSASASTGLTLYDFGRRETTLAIAERTLAASGLGYDSTLQGFIATALQTYFSQLTAQNALAVERESNELSKATLDATETRYSLGLVPLSDVLQARTRYSQTQLSLERAENAVVLGAARLAQLMGFSPLTELKVAELDDANILVPPFNSALTELIEKAKEQRVDLKSRQLQLESAKDSLKNTRRRNLPTISASAGRSYSDWDVLNQDHPPVDTVGVTVSIPIFTGFGSVFSERAQRKQLESQIIQYEDAERDVEQDVLRSWQNYSTARTSYDISISSLGVARQFQDVALGRYKEGIGSILDVLNAQDSYRNSLQSHLNSRYSLLTARVDLIRAVGALDLNNVEPQGADMPAMAAVVSYKDPRPNKGSTHEIR